MSPSLFRSIVDQLRGLSFLQRRLDLTGLGEPLLNPELVSMVRYAKRLGFRVSLTSNFTTINQDNAAGLIGAGLNYLYVSFDGASRETFEKLRHGADFDRIVRNVGLFIKTRKDLNVDTPRLLFETTVSELNVHEVPEIVKLGESLNIDGMLFYRPVLPGKSDYVDDSFASVDWKELSKNGVEIQVGSFGKPVRPCIGVFGCYVTFDGKVLQCNRMIQLLRRKDYALHQFGDVNESSLPSIWFSDRYRKFRTRIGLGLYSGICEYCPTGSYYSAGHSS